MGMARGKVGTPAWKQRVLCQEVTRRGACHRVEPEQPPGLSHQEKPDGQLPTLSGSSSFVLSHISGRSCSKTVENSYRELLIFFMRL